MATEKMEAFLAALRANPGAAEKLNNGEKGKTEEEKIGAITELAREMGYELTKEDVAAYMAETAQARKEKTDAQIQGIEMLEDDELDGVAGGIKGNPVGDKHKECRYDFLNRENCDFTDACDNAFFYYDDYLCYEHNYDADPDMVYPWQPEYICEAGEPNAR